MTEAAHERGDNEERFRIVRQWLPVLAAMPQMRSSARCCETRQPSGRVDQCARVGRVPARSRRVAARHHPVDHAILVPSGRFCPSFHFALEPRDLDLDADDAAQNRVEERLRCIAHAPGLGERRLLAIGEGA